MARTFGQILGATHSKSPRGYIPRSWQIGDALSESFRAANPVGFDPSYDVGDPGPGDAMSEFKGYDHYTEPHLPLYDGNSWDNLILYTSSYIDPRNPITTDIFRSSNPMIAAWVEWKTGAPQLAAWPIRIHSRYYGKLREIFLHTPNSVFATELDMLHDPGRNGIWPLTRPITGTDLNENDELAIVSDSSYKYLHIVGHNSRVVGTQVSWWWSNNLEEDPNATWYETGRLSGTRYYYPTLTVLKELISGRSSTVTVAYEIAIPGTPPGSTPQYPIGTVDYGVELTEKSLEVSANGMVSGGFVKEGEIIRLIITYTVDYGDGDSVTKVRYQSLTEDGFEQGLRITDIADDKSNFTWTWETIIN